MRTSIQACVGGEKRLRRFYDAMEDGAIDPSKPTFKERLTELREKRDLAKVAEDRVLAELQPPAKLTDKGVKKFADFARTQLGEGNLQFKTRVSTRRPRQDHCQQKQREKYYRSKRYRSCGVEPRVRTHRAC